MNLKKISLSLIILLPFILFFPYFYTGFPIELIGSDLLRVWGYNGTPIFDFYRSLKSSLHLSFWSASFSRPHFNLTSELPELFQTILYIATRNPIWIFKLDTAIHMIVAGLGSYMLSYYFLKNHLTAFLSGIIYMLSPFTIDFVYAGLGKPWAMALMPWGYLFIHKALFLAFDLKNIFISAIFVALTLLGHPENFFLGGIFYILFIALLSIFYFKDILPGKIPTLVLLTALVFLLTSFTYLPSLLHPYPYTHVEPKEIETWLRLNANPSFETLHQSEPLLPSFLLLDWEWLVTLIINQKIPFFAILWGIVFILTLVALMKKTTPKIIIIFGLLSVLGLWFSSGLLFPQFSIYAWLHHLIPHFRMTRHPDRYLFHVVLAFSIIAPWAFNILNPSFKHVKKISVMGISCFLIGCSYFYAKTTSFTFYPFQKPEYIDKIMDWLTTHNTDNHRIINAYGCPNFSTISFKTHAMADQLLINYYHKDYFSDLLSLFGFKYIIIGKQPQDTGGGFSMFHFQPDLATTPQHEETWTKFFSNLNNRKIIFDSLNQNTDFIPHPLEGTDVVIFENKKTIKAYELYGSKPLLILGSYQAYDFLSHPELAHHTPLSPVFLAQDKNQNSLTEITRMADTLILHNSTLNDLALLLNKSSIPWTPIYSFRSDRWKIGFEPSSIPQINPQLPTLDHSWLLNSLGGNIIFSKFSIINQQKDATLTLPISISELNQKIFLRLKYMKDTSITASFDHETKTLPPPHTGGFHWIELPFTPSQKGPHTLTLSIQDPESVYLDTLAQISQEQWRTFITQTLDQFKDLQWIQFLQDSEFIVHHNKKITLVNIPASTSYTIHLFSPSPAPRPIPLEIDNQACTLVPQTKNRASCSLSLAAGQHKVSVPNQDFKWLSIRETKQGIQKSEELFLTHTETYFPGWKLLTSTKIIHPLITHLFMNGFIVSAHTSSYQAVYRNTIHRIFAGISLITLLGIISFLGYRKIR